MNRIDDLQNQHVMEPKVRRLYFPKIKITVAFGVLVIVFLAVFKGFLVVRTLMRDTGLTPGTIIRLLLDTGATLKTNNGKTNILIMGMGGGNHIGADLTDTMMVASVDFSHNALTLISVPRDTWSDTLKDKVNSSYHYGEDKKKGGGMLLSKSIVEEIVGIPVHYVFLIDFSGYKELIDMIGGIDVIVQTAFVDKEFPIEGKENDLCDGDITLGCRYETITFPQGKQHMDGTTALKYVRSRHADGEEGSDFARSRRQQDVIIALRQKITDPKLWTSPKRIRAFFSAVDKATDTDMNIGELATFAKLAASLRGDQIRKISLEDQLISPSPWFYGGRYVLTPAQNYEELHIYIKEKLGIPASK